MRQIRRELGDAEQERREIDQRIGRLRAAEAALQGAESPHAKILTREQIKDHLKKRPGSRAIEIADALQARTTNVRTLLSTLKKTGEVRNTDQRWYLTRHN